MIVLTSAFIALLVESPVGDKETQMGQSVSFFDHVNVDSLLINHAVNPCIAETSCHQKWPQSR